MGNRIITRTVTTLTSTTKTQEFPGCYELVGISADYGDSASGSVLTIKEKDSDGLTKFTISTDTDFGTTVPLRIFHDARLISGAATAGVGLNPVFFEGVYVSLTAPSATTNSQVTLWLRPLIYKKVQLTGVTDAKVAFQGSGMLKGARVNYGSDVDTGADIQISDTVTITSSAPAAPHLTVVGNTATDWAAVNQQVVTTTNTDEAGTGVTTAATGSYANDGVCFRTGLTVGIAQGTALAGAVVDFAIEA